jgi:hypothetical protein
VYVTFDNPSMERLKGLAATLIGYGPTRWEASGDYSHSPMGVEHIGEKPVTEVELGYVRLAGEQGGALPGDSGGPILAPIDGVTKVVALNQGMAPGEVEVAKTDRNGDVKKDRHGRVKTRKVTVYGDTIGTMLTRSNLCWVEKDTGIEIPGVDCSAPATEKTGK